MLCRHRRDQYFSRETGFQVALVDWLSEAESGLRSTEVAWEVNCRLGSQVDNQ